MKLSDLEPFEDVPFYLWVKDEAGTYIWGNKAMAEFAGGDVAGKTDADLAPPNTAAMMRHHDIETLETGEPVYLHEAIEGAGNLSVCKWAGELEGKPAAFGVSFQTDD
jgi:carotenoid cleavage dioxygenase-like enzyme